MNRRAVVTFPVQRYRVDVIAARDVPATCRRLQAPLSGAMAAFITDTARPMRGWMVVPPDADEATVAHEASHAVRAMFAEVGARNDDEAFAYHLDFLVGRVHRFLKKGKECS